MKKPAFTDIFPLPDQVKTLQVFIGNWDLEGTLIFRGKTFKVKGLGKFTSVAAGWGILSIVKMGVEDLGTYEEVDILGFNRSEQMFHFFALTNTAAAYDHKGEWKDNKTINFVYEGQQYGKTYKEELEIKIQNSSELTICENDYLDGQLITTMSVKLKKQISEALT
ncbi:MAG TPA: DUF1579 family protein [Candidatus Acidoferrum sp.]|nr:DUF1579 family protein [Candidatus Acidoferrum sp.]